MSYSTLLPPLGQAVRSYLVLAEELLQNATPQEATLAAFNPSAKEGARLDRSLQGVALVARHALITLIQSLRTWHAQMLADIQKAKPGASNPALLRAKRVVLDCLLFEPAIVMLAELRHITGPVGPSVPVATPGLGGTTRLAAAAAYVPLRPEHTAFCNDLKDRCFEWLMKLDELLPQDMPVFRQHIFGAVSRTLGAVSAVHLPPTVATFRDLLGKLVDQSNKTAMAEAVRPQILRLCAAMQAVVLVLGTEDAVRHAARFLEAMNPTRFTPGYKKSQLQHALCDMLTAILTPLVRSGQPLMSERLSGTPVMYEWFSTISALKDAVWLWMQKHEKHIKAGWMLGTVLVCLLDQERFSANRDAAADFLLKQLKSKDNRGLAVKCLVQLITSMLVRFGKAQSMPRPELTKLLDKVVRGGGGRDATSLMHAAKKAYLTTGELQDVLGAWADLAPEYTLSVAIELVQVDGVPDCVLAGLMGTYKLLHTLPPGAAALVQGAGAGGAQSSGPQSQGSGKGRGGREGGGGVDVLDLMRGGYHPVDLLGVNTSLLPRLTAALSKLWVGLHNLYGSPNAPGMGPSVEPRDRNQALAHFRCLLRLTATTRPDGWLAMKPLDLLPGYLSHRELSSTAALALEEIVRGCPGLRNTVLVGVASHCAALSDDNPKVVQEVLVRLQRLADQWAAHVRARAAGEVSERGPPESAFLDLPRLEGITWAAGLCSPDEGVRGQALQVLASLRSLHQALLASPPYQPPPAPALLAVHLSALPPSSAASLPPTVAYYSSAGASHGTTGLSAGGPSGVHTMDAAGAGAGPVAHPLALHTTTGGGALPVDMSMGGGAVGLGGGGGRSTSGSATPVASIPGNAAGMLRGTTLGGAPSGGAPPLPPSSAARLLHHARRNSHASVASSQEAGAAGGGATPNSGSGAWAGIFDVLEPAAIYMCDVLEQSGPDLVRAAYWDWGDLSDLNAEYKDVPLVTPSYQDLLTSASWEGDAKLRLTRLLVGIAKTMAVISPHTAAAALHELCAGRLQRLAVKDRDTGRMVVHQEKADAWRFGGAIVLALPGSLRDMAHGALGGLASISVQSTGGMAHSGSMSSLSGAAAAGGSRSQHARGSTPGLSIRDVVRCHVSLIAPGAADPSHQGCSVLALGHAHHSHYEVVLEELQWLVEEMSGTRPSRNKGTLLNLIMASEAEYVNKGAMTAGRTRLEEVRRVQAHVLRLLAQNAPNDMLASRAFSHALLRKRLVDWLHATLVALKDARPSSDVLWENVQLAYCFASVIHKVCDALCDTLNLPSSITAPKDSAREVHKDPAVRASILATTTRKAMYDLLATWTADAMYLDAEFRNVVTTGIRATCDKLRMDPEAAARRDALERELMVWAAALDHMARGALAALLRGPLLDADTRRPGGPVLQWVDRMLQSSGASGSSRRGGAGAPYGAFALTPLGGGAGALHMRLLGVSGAVAGPPRPEVGRAALLNLLQSALELFPVYLDKSYDSHAVVAATYFQVLCDVYTDHEVTVAPHILVSLILYKMVDPITEVREDARHMLGVLATRVWGAPSFSLMAALPRHSGSGGPPQAHVGGSGPLGRDMPPRASGHAPATLALRARNSSSGGHALLARSAAAAGGGVPSTPTAGAAASEAFVGSPRTPQTGAMPPLPAAFSPLIPGTKHSAPGPGTERQQGSADGGGSGGDSASSVQPTWLPPDAGSAFSTLLDTYQDNQHEMSELLASTHPELSEELCEEMMTRALECSDSTIQQPVLTSLTPWMNNLTIAPQWKGTWSERLLKSMYYVTQRHGSLSPYEIQALWCTLASLKDNVRHMLLFLVDMGMAAGQQDMASLEAYLAVSKRICLYLARTHPQFTIDQLQTEIMQQVQETDGSSAASSYRPPVEFEQLLGDARTGGGASMSELVGLPGGTTLGGVDPLGAVWASEATQLMYDAGLMSGKGGVSTGGGLGAAGDWRGGQGGDARPRISRSGEGSVISHIVPRLPSNTSSRSSNTASQSDLRPSGNLALSGLAAGRIDALRAPSSQAGGGDAGSAVDAAPPTPGLYLDSGRVARESGASGSSHGGFAGPAGGGITASALGAGLLGEEPGSVRNTSMHQSMHQMVMRSTGGGRTLISRPELAVCLLSEVAFACDEEFTGGLPLLLHACCVMLDAESPLVHSHAAALLMALVHSVGSWAKEQAQESEREVDMGQLHQLICFLQSMRGKRLWAYEDTSCSGPPLASYSALQTLVRSTVEALHWMDGLQVSWAEHALEWALRCCSRHISGRSFQVFRALRPPLGADLLTTLLLCLHTCLDIGSGGSGGSMVGGHSAHLNGPPGGGSGSGGAGGRRETAGGGLGGSGPGNAPMAADCALEVLHTLQALVDSVEPPSRLVLHPQVFWLALSLLHSPVVALYAAGLQLLAAFMRLVPLHQSKVLNVLLAAAPGISGHILLHSSMASGKLGARGSEKGAAADLEVEDPELWALGGALLQLPVHDLTGQRHAPLAVQQLLLRGLLVTDTLPGALHALADLAAVLELQGAALQQNSVLRDATNGGSYGLGGSGGGDGLGDVLGVGAVAASPAFSRVQASAGGPADSLRKHRLLRLDAHQALLGPTASQLLISVVAATLQALALNHVSAAAGPRTPESVAAASALSRCLVCLSRAADAHGLVPLVAPLQQAAHVWCEGAGGVPLAYPPNTTKGSLSRALLRNLTAALAACFFPRYAPLVIHHCLDSLSQENQPPAKHLAVLTLLHALFSVLLEDLEAPPPLPPPTAPSHRRGGSSTGLSGLSGAIPGVGLERLPLLGPVAMAALTSPALLAPITAKPAQQPHQGALAAAAADALSAIVAYSAAWQTAHSALYGGDGSIPSSVNSSWQLGPGGPGGASGPGSVGTPVAASALMRSSLDVSVPPPVLRTLYPAAVNPADAVRLVIDTLGASARRSRRLPPLLPHLSASLHARGSDG